MAEKKDAAKQAAPKTPRVPKPVDPNAPKCINPECGKPARTRGLCVTCYTVARELIKDGKTTWEKLVDQGKALGRAGRNGSRRAQAKAWLVKEG